MSAMPWTIAARENLMKAVKATGARWDEYGQTAILEVRGRTFCVQHRQITADRMWVTCYYPSLPSGENNPLPPHEAIATTLLLLHHNPDLYTRIARQNGPVI